MSARILKRPGFAGMAAAAICAVALALGLLLAGGGQALADSAAASTEDSVTVRYVYATGSEGEGDERHPTGFAFSDTSQGEANIALFVQGTSGQEYTLTQDFSEGFWGSMLLLVDNAQVQFASDNYTWFDMADDYFGVSGAYGKIKVRVPMKDSYGIDMMQGEFTDSVAETLGATYTAQDLMAFYGGEGHNITESLLSYAVTSGMTYTIAQSLNAFDVDVQGTLDATALESSVGVYVGNSLNVGKDGSLLAVAGTNLTFAGDATVTGLNLYCYNEEATRFDRFDLSSDDLEHRFSWDAAEERWVLNDPQSPMMEFVYCNEYGGRVYLNSSADPLGAHDSIEMPEAGEVLDLYCCNGVAEQGVYGMWVERADWSGYLLGAENFTLDESGMYHCAYVVDEADLEGASLHIFWTEEEYKLWSTYAKDDTEAELNYQIAGAGSVAFSPEYDGAGFYRGQGVVVYRESAGPLPEEIELTLTPDEGASLEALYLGGTQLTAGVDYQVDGDGVGHYTCTKDAYGMFQTVRAEFTVPSIAVSTQEELLAALNSQKTYSSIDIIADFTLSTVATLNLDAQNYRDTVIVIDDGVTLTVAEDGLLSMEYYDDREEHGEGFTAKLINYGTLIVNANGAVLSGVDNHGAICVKEGGTIGCYLDTQIRNYGSITVEDGGMVGAEGQGIFNACNGSLVIDGALMVSWNGSLDDQGSPQFSLTFDKGQGASISGDGEVRLYCGECDEDCRRASVSWRYEAIEQLEAFFPDSLTVYCDDEEWDFSRAVTGISGNVRNVSFKANAPTARVSMNGLLLDEGAEYELFYDGSPTVPSAEGSYTVTAVAKAPYRGSCIVGTLSLYGSPVIEGVPYLLHSAVNGEYVLDVENAMPVRGSNVSIWTSNGGKNQRFTFELGDDGYFIIRNVANSSLVLDAAGANPSAGSNVSTWTYNGGINQKWIMIPADEGCYKIASAANPNLVLDTAAEETALGTNVVVGALADKASQRWSLEDLYDVNRATVDVSGLDRMYTGSQLEASVTVTLDGRQLVEGEDYHVLYDGLAAVPVEAGEYEVDIQGYGLYSGFRDVGTLTIYAADAVRADGTIYHVVSCADDDYVLDVAGYDPVKGSNVSVWTSNGGANQYFTFELGDDGYYVIRNFKNKALVLDASGAVPEKGANVSTWTANGGLNQRWIVVPAAGGGYQIACAANTSLVLDAAGAQPSIGANVSVWTPNGGANQRWTFTEGYVMEDAQVSVSGLERMASGTPISVTASVVLYDRELDQVGSEVSQADGFKLYYEGTGETSYAKSIQAPTEPGTYAITVAGSGKVKGEVEAGTLTIYAADAVRADGTIYHVVSCADDDYVLDVAGYDPVKGSNVSVWTSNGGANQYFTFELGDDGYYVIRNFRNTALVLDASGAVPEKGANVSTWTANGGLNQKWIVVPAAGGGYQIACAANTSLVLDAAGAQPSIGANVSVWTPNGGANQRWTFTEGYVMEDAKVTPYGLDRMYTGGQLDVTVHAFLYDEALTRIRDAESDDDGFKVYYEGVGSTEYEKSMEAPSAVGTYKVTAVGSGKVRGTCEVGTLTIYSTGVLKTDGTRYRIHSAANGALVVDASGTKPASGSDVTIWTVNGGDNQVFTLELNSDGYYLIRNVANDRLLLTTPSVVQQNGNEVNVWVESSVKNQEWVIVPAEDGNYKIMNAYDGSYVVEAVSSSPKPGASVDIWEYNGGSNQKWIFLEVS